MSHMPARRFVTSALLAAAATLPPLPALGDGRVDENGKIVMDLPAGSNVIDLAAGDAPKVTSRCYLDISIDGKPVGRLVVDLYGEVVPRTAENFRRLCTGQDGFGYAGSSFYRVISQLTLQGGNIPDVGRSEGRSVYGGSFAHENYAIKHSVAGLLSTVNSGTGGGSQTADSRFLIQLQDDAGYLDGRYSAFGRVVQGMDVVRAIEGVPVKGSKNRPITPVTIEAAGELPLPGAAPANAE